MIEIDVECESCNGTGLYQGMGEGKGVAVVCSSCKGTGKSVIHYREFTGRKPSKGIKWVYRLNPGIYIGGENPGEFGETSRRSPIQTFAVLKDGKWYEKGQMGWWGIVSNRKSKTKWNSEFKKLIEGLSDDTLLTVVDCHI